MTLKTFLLPIAFAMALTTGSIAQAQTPPPDNGAANGAMLTPEQRIEKRLAHEQKVLGLTDDQVAKLKVILAQNMAKIRADRQAAHAAAEGSPERKAARQQAMADKKALRGQLKDVLTAEQLKKFKEMRLEQIDRQEHRLEHQKKMLKK